MRLSTLLAGAVLLASVAACSGDSPTGANAARIDAGSLLVTVSGLPSGAAATLRLQGASASRDVSAGVPQTAIEVGQYTLTANVITVDGWSYDPVPVTQNVNVATNQQASASVTYTRRAGTINVVVGGLPAGVDAAVNITGPGGYARTITASTTIPDLVFGTYTFTTSNVAGSGVTYSAQPAIQQVVISTSIRTASTVVTYAGGNPANGDDLSIAFAYVTQATQRPDGSVPLVAGRDAFMRVFVVNSRTQSLRPRVRIRVFNGTTQVQEVVLDGQESTARTDVAEGVLASSWNLLIPAANVQPNLRVQAFVDPDNAVPESNEGNNFWPADGVPQAVAVHSVPDLNIRFVPVTIAALTGNVSEANKDDYLVSLRRMFPVNTINSSVRLPFTSSATVLQADDANKQWLTVLNEMNALRATDGAPSNMHYYGVVKVPYGSGIAGYGFVPGRAATGWDHLPSGDGVAAHEWGHNFGRPHSPCGSVGSPDPGFPYTGGAIGMFGWNVSTGNLIQSTATDIMGYCSNKWISDYTWTRVMMQRQSAGAVASEHVAGNVQSDGLLVSATIVNGIIAVSPAYRVEASSTAPSSAATHVVEAVDRRGRVIAELPVHAETADHATDDARAFSVVLPWGDRMERSLARLRVRDIRSPVVSASISSATAEAAVDENRAPVLPDAGASIERPRSDRARIRFNARYRSAMVKDATTGQIIAFVGKSGDEIIARDGRAIDVVYSDGVRSVTRRHQR